MGFQEIALRFSFKEAFFLPISSSALNKPDDELLELLMDIRRNRQQACKALNIDAQIGGLMKKHPLLKEMGADLGCALPRVVCLVMKGGYRKALDLLSCRQFTRQSDR